MRADGADDLLCPLLDAPDDETARRAIERLLVEVAQPIVRGIVRGQCRSGLWSTVADGDDVEQSAMATLAACLARCRAHDPPAPIRSFPDYVAVVAYNASHALLRARAPSRDRLRARIRYLLTHHPGLRLVAAPGHHWLATLPAWTGAESPASPDDVRQATERLRQPTGRPDRTARAALAPIIVSLLERLGRPCALDALVAALADHLQVSDAVRSLDERAEPSAGEPSAEDQLAWRDRLTYIWREIRDLPERQRAALLLNLRDEAGGGMIEFLPATGVAALAEIAATVGMSESELTAIWPTLPRDDEWIGGRLGLTRQQVSNLRKCARERLFRRLQRPAVGRRSGTTL